VDVPLVTASAPRQHHGVTLAVLCVAGIAYGLSQAIVAPALPAIQADLGISAGAINWVVSANLLAVSVLTPLLGRLGDMFGKGRMLVAVLVITVLGTLICALSSSLGMLLVGRVVQGAAGGIFPLAFGIIRDEFPPARISAGIGMMTAVLAAGGGSGILLSGSIVEHLDVSWLFWIPLFGLAAAAVGAALLIPESPVRSSSRINWVAVLLLSLGLAAVLLGVSQASDHGWTAVRTLGLVVAGLVFLALWIRVELRAAVPLVDMRMMRLRGVWTTNLTTFLLGWGMFESFFLLPRLVQEPESTGYGFGATVTETGLMLLPAAAAQLLVGSQAGRLERRFGSKPPLIAGVALVAVAYAVFTFAHEHIWQIYLGNVISGVGIGLAYATLPTLIVAAVRLDQTGVATGVNTIMITLGGAIGSQVAATFVAADLLAGGEPAEGGFTLAFAVGGLVVILGLLAALAVPRGRPSARPVVDDGDGRLPVPGGGTPDAGEQTASVR
jgi:EmrB/QacA subfamily drug resistance transporter